MWIPVDRGLATASIASRTGGRRNRRLVEVKRRAVRRDRRRRFCRRMGLSGDRRSMRPRLCSGDPRAHPVLSVPGAFGLSSGGFPNGDLRGYLAPFWQRPSIWERSEDDRPLWRHCLSRLRRAPEGDIAHPPPAGHALGPDHVAQRPSGPAAQWLSDPVAQWPTHTLAPRGSRTYR